MVYNGPAFSIILWPQSLWQAVLLQSRNKRRKKTFAFTKPQIHETEDSAHCALEPPVTKVLCVPLNTRQSYVITSLFKFVEQMTAK